MTLTVHFQVLSVIQEKVNNPSADDPFEPEIAGVSREKSMVGITYLINIYTTAIKERQSSVLDHCKRMDEEVSRRLVNIDVC